MAIKRTPIPSAESQPFLTVPEAARCLGVGRELGYQMAQTGELPTVKVGTRQLRVPTAELRRIAGLDSTPASKHHLDQSA